MCVETFDCTVASESAAAENEPRSAIATRAFSWRRSIESDDNHYLLQLFD
jgi:hypothetical protein